jgi:hypothetical protein
MADDKEKPPFLETLLTANCIDRAPSWKAFRPECQLAAAETAAPAATN